MYGKPNWLSFLKLAAVAVLTLATFAGAATKNMRKPKMNVVLIMADDIGYECFSWHGGSSYKTPNLDKMAANGAVFTNCHSQPLCTPSRVKIMTGQVNSRNYYDFCTMLPEEYTFGNMMQDYGYKTYVAGKWQLYGWVGENTQGKGMLPAVAGFDEWCMWYINSKPERYWGPTLNINGTNTTYPSKDFGPEICTDNIIDFIRDNKDEPFFVYYPMILTHSPFVRTPDSHDNNYSNNNIAANFKDMVPYTDKLVGRITQTLEELGLTDNTLVIFTGDNGTHSDITSILNGKSVAGGKVLTTDAGTHVPLVVSLAGSAPGGIVCDDLVDFSDFLPTIAEATGAPLPTIDHKSNPITLDGRSFFPQVMGKEGDPREWIYVYYNPQPVGKPELGTRFARDKRWKLYGNGASGTARKVDWLYDVINDVLEQYPIKPTDPHSDEAAAARIKLSAAIATMPAPPIKLR